MKPAILFIILFAITLHVFSQGNNAPNRYQQYAGRYGGNSGICLFEDGRFLLYGYATAVFGSYHFEKDYLLFVPDKPELFEVYAHYNKSLGDSTRINFSGFEEGETFVQWNKEKAQRAFNENANCFDAPFVYQIPQKILSFRLSFVQDASWWSSGKSNQSWHYPTENNYNDFIWIFNKPKQEYEDFSAQISVTPEKTLLRLSNYGGNEGYIKQVRDKDELKQWEEIMDWKKEYDEAKQNANPTIFANKHYGVFPQPDSLNYTLNAATNEYISKKADNNEAYYRSNPYEDGRFLRKYIKLMPGNKDTANFNDANLANNSIFYTVCGAGVRPSYHYKGYEEYEQPEKGKTPLIEVPPVPLLEATPYKIPKDDHKKDSIKNSGTAYITNEHLNMSAGNSPEKAKAIYKKVDKDK